MEYIGRIVVVLSPILMGLAAWFSTWAADNLPNAPAIDPDELGKIGIAAVLGVAGIVYKWLDNRGKHERGQAGIDGG